MNPEQETELGRELRRLVTGHTFDTDVETDVRELKLLGHRARRRVRVVRGVVGVGVVALAAGAAFAGLHGNSVTAPPQASAGKAPAPHPQTVAYVIQRTSAALDDANDYILQLSWYKSVGKTLEDEQTGAVYETPDSSGTEVWMSDKVAGNVDHFSQTLVNHQARTWSKLVDDSAILPGAASQPSRDAAFGTPAQVKRALNSGTFTIIGQGDDHGRQVIKLKAVNTTRTGIDVDQVWVDARTYQPVHVVISWKGQEVDIDEAWLPRAADTVNMINNPQVPAGYRQVSAGN